MQSADSSEGVVEDADDLDGAASAEPSEEEVSNDTSDALDISGKKQLRTVAFPPLPRERDGNETGEQDSAPSKDSSSPSSAIRCIVLWMIRLDF